MEASNKKNEHEIEYIDDHRYHNGRLQYKVKWKNLSSEQNEWIFEKHMKKFKDTISTYERSRNQKKSDRKHPKKSTVSKQSPTIAPSNISKKNELLPKGRVLMNIKKEKVDPQFIEHYTNKINLNDSSNCNAIANDSANQEPLVNKIADKPGVFGPAFSKGIQDLKQIIVIKHKGRVLSKIKKEEDQPEVPGRNTETVCSISETGHDDAINNTSTSNNQEPGFTGNMANNLILHTNIFDKFHTLFEKEIKKVKRRQLSMGDCEVIDNNAIKRRKIDNSSTEQLNQSHNCDIENNRNNREEIISNNNENETHGSDNGLQFQSTYSGDSTIKTESDVGNDQLNQNYESQNNEEIRRNNREDVIRNSHQSGIHASDNGLQFQSTYSGDSTIKTESDVGNDHLNQNYESQNNEEIRRNNREEVISNINQGGIHASDNGLQFQNTYSGVSTIKTKSGVGNDYLNQNYESQHKRETSNHNIINNEKRDTVGIKVEKSFEVNQNEPTLNSKLNKREQRDIENEFCSYKKQEIHRENNRIAYESETSDRDQENGRQEMRIKCEQWPIINEGQIYHPGANISTGYNNHQNISAYNNGETTNISQEGQELDSDEYVQSFICEGGSVLYHGLLEDKNILIREDGQRFLMLRDERGEYYCTPVQYDI